MTACIQSNSLRIFSILLIFAQSSCKKFVQVDLPSSSITGLTVYSNNGSAAAVMTGLYARMSYPPNFFTAPIGMSYYMGMAADELRNYDPTAPLSVQFYTNSLTSGTLEAPNNYFWPELYYNIYVANAALEGIKNSSALSASTKQQITGEAKFTRAFLLFYATNLYGDIPMPTTTSYIENDSISKSSQSDVYNQILADLKDAQSKLTSGFVDALGNSSTERTRPNQEAATAMLARVYLYTRKWDSAENQSTAVINNSAIYSLDDSVNDVFLANSTETIWQLQPTQTGFNTQDAMNYVLRGVPGVGRGAAMSSYLSNAFEPGDARFRNWVGSFIKGATTYHYPFKYKIWQRNQPLTEYIMVLRLAEQYLIRAEARAQQGNIQGAQNDLNTIRVRAGLDSTTANDQPSLLAAIMHERQLELFTEWGHRWFDLKRTDSLNAVMGNPGNVFQAKGGNGVWSMNWSLLPIPYEETIINHNLGQNPGY